MSDTMDPMATDADQQELAQQLLAQAKEQGIELVGPGGLLNRLTKNVLETALEAETDVSPRIRQARRGRARKRELPQRHPHQDRPDRDRGGGNRRAAGHRLDVRPADRQKTAAAADGAWTRSCCP